MSVGIEWLLTSGVAVHTSRRTILPQGMSVRLLANGCLTGRSWAYLTPGWTINASKGLGDVASRVETWLNYAWMGANCRQRQLDALHTIACRCNTCRARRQSVESASGHAAPMREGRLIGARAFGSDRRVGSRDWYGAMYSLWTQSTAVGCHPVIDSSKCRFWAGEGRLF